MVLESGTNEERAVIWRRHVEFTQGLLWFWMSDPAVPVTVREELAQFGHCTDEYDADSDPPHWPHQLFVDNACFVISIVKLCVPKKGVRHSVTHTLLLGTCARASA